MQLVGAGEPMERIATDIMGPLPETDFQNKYILVISDYFSKWVEAVTIPHQTAGTMAAVLFEEVVCRFHTPISIPIKVDYLKQLSTRKCQLEIKKTRTTPCHPESDGMVKRFNITPARLLSAFVSKNILMETSFFRYSVWITSRKRVFF